MRGSWRLNKYYNILTPHSYGHQRCVFLVLRCCSTGGPGAKLSAGFLYHILSPTSLVPNSKSGVPRSLLPGNGFLYHILSLTRLAPNSLGVPRAPSAGWWLSLPHLGSNFSDLQLTDFLSSPSYIIVQSPTQSLE